MRQIFYTWSVVGMPRPETASEELLCHVLGDQFQDRVITKLADILCCVDSIHEELLSNW